MAKREPKSRFVVTVGVVGRNGNKKGRIEISSGNLAYYRVGAKDVTLKVTQQRLVDILENEIAFEEINVNRYKLPAPRENGDFSIEAWEVDEAEDYYPIIFASSSWRNFEKCKMGVDCGSYLAYPVCCHSRPPLVKTILANRAKIGVIALFTPVLLPAECSNKLVSSQMAP